MLKLIFKCNSIGRQSSIAAMHVIMRWGLVLLIFMQEIPTHVASKNARLWIDYTGMLQEEVVNKDGSIARLSLYQPMN